MYSCYTISMFLIQEAPKAAAEKKDSDDSDDSDDDDSDEVCTRGASGRCNPRSPSLRVV